MSGDASSPVASTDLTSLNCGPSSFFRAALRSGDSSVSTTAFCSLVTSTELPGLVKRFWLWSVILIHATEEYRFGSWLLKA